jgi:hypothetical protein
VKSTSIPTLLLILFLLYSIVKDGRMFRAAEEMLRIEGKSLDQAKGPMFDQTKYGLTTSSTAKAD